VDLWLLEGRYGSISEEMWQGLCRHLAFLKSDLEQRRWHDYGHTYLPHVQRALKRLTHTTT
jgi:hypothetical protein